MLGKLSLLLRIGVAEVLGKRILGHGQCAGHTTWARAKMLASPHAWLPQRSQIYSQTFTPSLTVSHIKSLTRLQPSIPSGPLSSLIPHVEFTRNVYPFRKPYLPHMHRPHSPTPASMADPHQLATFSPNVAHFVWENEEKPV